MCIRDRNKSLYIVAFSLAFATTGIAQNNEGQDKTVDLGTKTKTELRKTQAVSTIYSDELDKMCIRDRYCTARDLSSFLIQV